MSIINISTRPYNELPSQSAPLLDSSTHLPILPNFTTSSNPSSNNCTNLECISDEDYLALIEDYARPSPHEWFFVSLYAIIFLIGVTGNTLVCAAVWRNAHLRTVTNYLLVNLAAADLLVLVCCLPPTAVWDITKSWLLGPVLCRIVPFLQTVSVCVSILTLVAISVERYSAIVHPLRLRPTARRTRALLLILWVIGVAAALPQVFTFRHKVPFPHLTSLLTECRRGWGSQGDLAYEAVFVILFYLVPVLAMSIAYCRVSRALWKSDGFARDARQSASSQPLKIRREETNGTKKLLTSVKPLPDPQLLARRKVAKMLVVVVCVFAICYLPLYLFQITKGLADVGAFEWQLTEHITIWTLSARCLVYFNSCVNPIIYNFMSEKYRREFQLAFFSILAACCPARAAVLKSSLRTPSRMTSEAGRGSATWRKELTPLDNVTSVSFTECPEQEQAEAEV